MNYGDCGAKADILLQASNNITLNPGESTDLTNFWNTLDRETWDFTWYRDSLYNENSIVQGPLQYITNDTYTVDYAQAGTYYLLLRIKYKPIAKICYALDSITIKQEANTTELNLSTHDINFEPGVLSQPISITSNTEWSISAVDEWIEISSANKIIGDSTLTINLLPNTTNTTRTGALTIKGNGTQEQTILITQKALVITDITNKKTSQNSHVFPTICEDILFVKTGQPTKTKIYSPEGKIVLETTVSGNEQIDISMLPKGRYYITVEYAKTLETETIYIR